MTRPRNIKPLSERNPFWLGVVATAALAGAVLLAVAVGTLGLGQARYTAEFAHAGGLRVGDEVRVAGMEVGEVTSTELAGDRVLVGFRANRSVHLGATTAATIKLSTLLGGRYLELRPSGPDELPDGRIPLAHTSVPYDLQKVLQTGTPLLEELDSAKLRQALQSTSANLSGNGQRITAALDGLSRASDVVVKRRDQIGQLIASTDEVTRLLNDRNGQIFALMGQSDTLLRALTQRRELIRGALTDLASVTDELRGLLRDNSSEITPLLDNAAELSEVLKRHDGDVDRALELLAPAGRYLANSQGNGPYWDVYLPYSIIPDNLLCQVGAIKGCKK